LDTLEAFVAVSSSLELMNQETVAVNRMNAMGDALEDFVRNAYADAVDASLSAEERRLRYERTFAWLGNSSNPPDLLLRGGDAAEVKKVGATSGSIQLNSSHPKERLWADDPRVASGAVTSESWISRDIAYWIGTVTGRRLVGLWVVFGDVFCARKETYTRVSQHISDAVNQVGGLEHGQTQELGRLNRVDPLGITSLRVRGMWVIHHPARVFQSLPDVDLRPRLRLLCRSEKYSSFSKRARSQVEDPTSGFVSEEILVADPNNPARSIPVRYVSYVL